MKKLIQNLTNLPVAVSGLALGTLGIGNVLAAELHPTFRYLCAIIAGLFLIMVLIKKFAHPKFLWCELTHPVLGSFIPAFDMALMVLSDIIAEFNLVLGQSLWYFAILLHIIFASIFIYTQIKKFSLHNMLPSWFVPPVGIVVAAVTSTNMNSPFVAESIFYFGFVLYCLILPAMLYRLIFKETIPDNQLPSFAIMGAPASLCLAGYLTVFKEPNLFILNFLLALALMMTSLVYLSIVRINALRINFMPIYASFTFPLAIGATALIKYANFIGTNSSYGVFWHTLGLVEMIIAVINISWVLFNMTRHVTTKVIFAK